MHVQAVSDELTIYGVKRQMTCYCSLLLKIKITFIGLLTVMVILLLFYPSTSEDGFHYPDFHVSFGTNGTAPMTDLKISVYNYTEKIKKDANRQMDKITSDYFNWRLETEPEWSTTLGVHRYNDKLESWNYRDFETRKNKAQRFLEQLLSIKKEDLDKTHSVSYDILKDVLTTYIDGYRWWKFHPLNPFNFLEGFLTNPKELVDVTPFETHADYLNFIVRIEKMPRQYDEMMETARLAIKYNHTLNNVSVNRIPRQIDELTANKSSFPFIEPFLQDKAAFVLGNTLQHMTERMKTAIKKFILKLKAVKLFIKNLYMPHTRKSWGIHGWKNGKQNYIHILRWHTSLTNITPEEVHQKGLDEVDRIYQDILKVMSRLGIQGTVQDFFTVLKKNSSFLIMEPEGALQRFREIIFDRILPELPKYFKNIPNLPIVVKNTPQDGIGGEYKHGSEDGARPGIFYVNIRRPENKNSAKIKQLARRFIFAQTNKQIIELTRYPTYSMAALTIHETVPGHHLAESYSLVSDLPPFRKYMNWRVISAPFYFPFYNSYLEGWALYAEYLGEEMGLYRDDFELMGRYIEEMFRACRLVVDTGLHYFGWDRQRAIEYLLNYTSYTVEGSMIEIDRYITWPGQACGYKIGELKIKELRKKAEQELGHLFDLSEFHYTILSNGPMPFYTLENVINIWISEVISRKL